MPEPTVDTRVLQLAQARHRIGHESYGTVAVWSSLRPDEQRLFLEEADTWLRAAVAAGIAPATDRPSGDHDAVWLDDHGQLWGEYQTSPSSHGDAILRLRWESAECSSKRELEERGVGFRLIGWSE
ncbi:MAG: hypothetical protein HOY75_09645 [Streptomyces sp.]|nr:hypothetical protein [Streptomyces sp.]